MAKKETSVSQKTVMTEKISERPLLKLHVPGESFWAYKISENTAEIGNILMNPDYCLGDIVSFNPNNNEVIKLIEKKTTTLAMSYSKDGDVKEKYSKIYTYFEDKNIKVEGMFAGVFLLAIPINIPEKAIEQIIAECPEKIDFIVD